MSSAPPSQSHPAPVSLSPLRAPEWGPAWHVPLSLTPLLGRDRELATVRALLDERDVRLVTLTGPGGVGKTRLALAVAAGLAADFAHGAAFVPLATVGDAALMPATVAGALGVREAGQRPVADVLRDALRDRHLLLLLDNLEQIPTAGGWLVDLLTSCPRLTVLATSRTPLHVRGERRFPVEPLPVPDGARSADLASLPGYAAVALFVERARAAQPQFALNEVNAASVAAICRRLDGLPLAIELAAARCTILSPAALLARLTNRLTVLTGGAQDLPTRLRTMRDAIAWSYDLLGAEEQALFRRLSVFVGGVPLDYVEGRVGREKGGKGERDGTPSPFPPFPLSPLDALASLVDHSLLVPAAQPDDGGVSSARFAMLETIREFGLERLAAAEELAAARDAHATFSLRLAEEAEERFKGPEQVVWLDRCEAEHDNIRAALSWLQERGAIEDAMRLAGALWFFRWIRGYYSEARATLETLVAHPNAQTRTAARARALNAIGVVALSQGDIPRSFAAHEEAMAIASDLGDEPEIALTLLCHAATANRSGDMERYEELATECLARYRALGDDWGIAGGLIHLAVLASRRGELDRAVAFYEAANAAARQGGDRWGRALTAMNLGLTLLDRGQKEQAGALLDEAMRLTRELGDKRDLPAPLLGLGDLAGASGDHALAATYYHEALAVARETGDKSLTGWALFYLGAGERALGNTARAFALDQQSLELFHEIGERLASVDALDALAALLAETHQDEAAARWQGASDALLKELGSPRPDPWAAEVEQMLASIRARIGAAAADAAYAVGEALPLEAAIAEALACQPPPEPPARTATAPRARPLLSRREGEVLRLMAEGLTNQEIADRLFLSRRTVTSHTTSILGKLNLDTRTAAVAYAIRHGLA